ncbi:AraC family transcriptional regulator [Variovorax sp. HJSM1_2]|uniref:AraC family transcriptional regulator n=1 Tax=Variovorax sp. HJSM1_2 TaxID=3366263 RepID=UPI003BE49910
MAFVHGVLQAYVAYGKSPQRVLEAAQITPKMLANPASRVTAAQFELLSASAMQELDDEALAWFSRPLPWGSYGLLCRASLSAPNLGVALQRWCRHLHLLVDDVMLQLHLADGVAHLQIHHTSAKPLPEFCLVTLLRSVHGFACWAVDTRILLQEASFPFTAPAHAEVYPLLFPGAHIHFNTSAAGFSFASDHLALPLVRDEAATRAMLRRAVSLTVRPYRRTRQLAAQVRTLLRQDSTSAAEALAHQLNISVRTLHRQLLAEGTTLLALKNEARLAHATVLLRQSAMPLKKVALAVGFQNEKSFARAFHAWTGQPPGAFRKSVEAA